jgi:uncharacterized protein
MKFVADVMLGSLARLMRFQGYDVEYDNRADDAILKRRSQYRMLLTKDRGLSVQIRSRNVYLVLGVGGTKQLHEILQHFPLENSSRRCIECNTKLHSIRKQKVKHLIPPFVFNKYKDFLHCPSCRRVYWTGTHFERMMRMLK